MDHMKIVNVTKFSKNSSVKGFLVKKQSRRECTCEQFAIRDNMLLDIEWGLDILPESVTFKLPYRILIFLLEFQS